MILKELMLNKMIKQGLKDSKQGKVTSNQAMLEKIKSFPEMGCLYSNHENKQIRILPYGHYRIAYHLKTKQLIDTLGVFHGALAIEKFI